jgi:hypothetical protein
MGNSPSKKKTMTNKRKQYEQIKKAKKEADRRIRLRYAIQARIDSNNATQDEIKELSDILKQIDTEGLNDTIYNNWQHLIDISEPFTTEIPDDLISQDIDSLVYLLQTIIQNIQENALTENYSDVIIDYNKINGIIQNVRIKKNEADSLYDSIKSKSNSTEKQIVDIQNVIDRIPNKDEFTPTLNAATAKLNVAKNTLLTISKAKTTKLYIDKNLDNMENSINEIDTIILNIKNDINNNINMLKQQIRDRLINVSTTSIQGFQNIQPYHFKSNVGLPNLLKQQPLQQSSYKYRTSTQTTNYKPNESYNIINYSPFT